MEAKQKAIQEAYGEHWEIVKDFVDENGWIDSHYKGTGFEGDVEPYGDYEILDFNDVRFKWRPLSLQGIENNNDWVKIESEADLPKDDSIKYKCCRFFDKNIYQLYDKELSCYAVSKYFKLNVISHYKPIQKPKPPIY